MQKESKRYVIVRSKSAGCFAGELQWSKSELAGVEVLLSNCRRLWYWDGAASLSQLAVEGTVKPETCKFSVPTSLHNVFEVIEVIEVSAMARRSIEEVSKWTA